MKALQPYVAAEFPGIFDLRGLSPELMQDHHKLYSSYVDNFNKTTQLLSQTTEQPTLGALTRQMSFEWNGIVLHEFFFSGLSSVSFASAPKVESHFEDALKLAFGSFEQWQKEFELLATTRGNGWAVLYASVGGQLMNAWVDQHHIGCLVEGQPIVVCDVWEHAYLKDYGLDRKAYLKAFFDNLNWPVARERYRGHF